MTELGEGEAEILESVFDVVGWCTPVAEDRRGYPGFKSFKDEKAVLEVVSKALEDLGE